MLVKRPSREGKYIKFMKYLIGVEIAVFGASYLVWKRMNISQGESLHTYTKFKFYSKDKRYCFLTFLHYSV